MKNKIQKESICLLLYFVIWDTALNLIFGAVDYKDLLEYLTEAKNKV